MTSHRATGPDGQVGGQAELDQIIAKQAPEMAKLTKAVLKKVRERLPGAVELVYEKRRGVVVGFCSDERASNVINSIAAYSKWLNLYFFEGDTLPIRKASSKAAAQWCEASG